MMEVGCCALIAVNVVCIICWIYILFYPAKTKLPIGASVFFRKWGSDRDMHPGIIMAIHDKTHYVIAEKCKYGFRTKPSCWKIYFKNVCLAEEKQ